MESRKGGGGGGNQCCASYVTLTRARKLQGHRAPAATAGPNVKAAPELEQAKLLEPKAIGIANAAEADALAPNNLGAVAVAVAVAAAAANAVEVAVVAARGL